MWSRLYKRCTKCHTSKRKHYGGGLCYTCYNNKRYADNPEPKQAAERKRYKKYRDLIRKRTSEYYYSNLKKVRKRLGIYRDKKHFNGMRKVILIRDDNTCQCCFGPGNIIHHRDGNG
jgi:uncharacterized Zn finger protein (UPF0148 family)